MQYIQLMRSKVCANYSNFVLLTTLSQTHTSVRGVSVCSEVRREMFVVLAGSPRHCP